MHSFFTQPTLIPKYRIIQAVRLLTCALEDAPDVCAEAQLQTIFDLRDVFAKCKSGDVTPTTAETPPRVLMPHVATPRVQNVAPSRVPAIPRQPALTQPPAPPASKPTCVSFSEDAIHATKIIIRVSARGNLLRAHQPGCSHQPVAHRTRSSRHQQVCPPYRRRRPCPSHLAHNRALH